MRRVYLAINVEDVGAAALTLDTVQKLDEVEAVTLFISIQDLLIQERIESVVEIHQGKGGWSCPACRKMMLVVLLMAIGLLMIVASLCYATRK